MLWVPICLVAGFIQTLRNGLQKSLMVYLPIEMVTWSRFLFGFPFALIYVCGLILWGYQLPVIPDRFWLYCLIGSITQVVGNVLLVSLFSRRNFVVGITYSKTEAILSALLAACLFGELITLGGLIAILVGMIGIVVISAVEAHMNPLKFLRGAANKVALVGVACGLCYAMTGVMIRQASIGLEEGSVAMNSALTLVVMLAMQSSLLGIWVFKKYDNVVARLKNNIRRIVLIGLANTLASIGWFAAFTLTKTAYVMAVGQVEVLFSLVLTHKVFKEKINALEIVGMLLVIISIFLLLFAG